jgi:2-C-methyl-D-erythritol 4-phosphate cytidylyltransferase
MPSDAKYAVIVAGGSGQRMGSSIPKQFLEMKGRPILMHTIEAFYNYPEYIKLVLVLPEPYIGKWKSLCKHYNFKVPVTLQPGGNSRFESVKQGLEKISGEGLVAIHDGVRPLVDQQLIERSFKTARMYNSAVAAIPLKNSLRQIVNDGSKAVDRSQYRQVQTPQTFSLSLLKEAYRITEQANFTDDAGVWEAAGHPVTLYEGSEKNLKITTIQDLVIAEMLLSFK